MGHYLDLNPEVKPNAYVYCTSVIHLFMISNSDIRLTFDSEKRLIRPEQELVVK